MFFTKCSGLCKTFRKRAHYAFCAKRRIPHRLLTAALCVHRFDPMVWVIFIIANCDIEISCDESVLGHFEEQKKQDYAMALIRMEEKMSGITPLPTHFSKKPIEERIVTIMKFKKATEFSNSYFGGNVTIY